MSADAPHSPPPSTPPGSPPARPRSAGSTGSRTSATSSHANIAAIRAGAPTSSGSSAAYSRTFPFNRASHNQPAMSPAAPARPSLPPTSRPSYISLPPRGLYDRGGYPSPDVTSPSGRQSVSSAESSGSRIAPDLGGSSARYFPMRSVMYPASSKASSAGARSQGGASSRSGPHTMPPGSAEAILTEEGFPDEDDVRVREGLSAEGVKHAAEELGILHPPRPRPESRSASSSGDRPHGPRRVSSRTEDGRSSHTAGTPASNASSDQNPPSLDPFLPEPTTHAKIGDPDSDEELHDDSDSHSRDVGSMVQEQDFADPLSHEAPRSPEDGASTTASTSASRTSAGEQSVHMTARFEHQIGEAGEHLVITGREGRLERCEDEPIHAPGAIQAFGVLIAFDLEDDERMTVQQVSENSGFIIGLPPRTLFKCRCLTDIFSEDEGDALRDAIDALDDRDSDPSNDEQGPYTFTLSGQGNPGTNPDDPHSGGRLEWTCHAAIHRPSPQAQPKRLVLELELVDDQVNPLTTVSSEPYSPDERGGMQDHAGQGENGINPTEADLVESTVSIAKPLRILARNKSSRLKRRKVRRAHDEMDVVSLLSQINDQLSKTDELETFLKITAGVFKELTEFDRVMVYQFDEAWNGRVVAEQVDWSRTKDLFRGLNFPATDIPPQARALYRLNKVRVLYDRDQPTARLCCRSVAEVEVPLDMTHCHLRAMSPIHIKYLGNMGVRSSMSISITAFGDLWGLIALHTYGRYGHRVSFPVRQLCKLLGQSISRNIERISYASRLQARKLINTAASDQNPGGYILAKADDLLDLFHADFGMLSIGDEAKILGQVSNSQELLAVLEYLRNKRFTTLKSTQDINADFPDIDYPNGFKLVAGLLCVPLSAEGRDFIFFCRSPQLQEVHWAGNPYANKKIGDDFQPLEPRKSFRIWSEVVEGKSRAWTDEEKETASVLCLVYGKFIAVWREKESALAASQLTNLLLANASHEVRTPLNAIINYLELALDGPIVGEVRENLVRSHAASKSLIHVINDLLDLTRTEKGNELFLTDPFNLAETLEEAVAMHRDEAERRGLALELVETPTGTPPTVLGDRAKIRQIITNVVANALKHTNEGGILVEWGEMVDSNLDDAREEKKDSIRIGISITDTGNGISERKLENLFRQFEQISTIGDKQRDDNAETEQAVGLGLAVVARIVRNLDGQLQVESKEGKGSKFTFIFPFRLPPLDADVQGPTSGQVADAAEQAERQISTGAVREPLRRRNSKRSADSAESRQSRGSSGRSDIDSLINAMSSSHMSPAPTRYADQSNSAGARSVNSAQSARSAQSTRSARSFRTAFSGVPSGGFSGSSGGSMTATADTAPGRISVNGSQVPLRASRVAPSSGSGAMTTSPLSSPNLSKLPLPTNPFFSNSVRSPLGNPSHLPRLERATSHMSQASETSKQSLDTGLTPRATSPQREHERRASQVSRISRASETSGEESPRHISQYRKASVASEVEDSIKPMRVLVVEDEMVNRMIIQQRLKKDGHEVVVAEHGGAAVRKFEEDRTGYDIVLMDLQMPIMNGVEASRNIRRIEREAPVDSDKQRETSRLNRGIPILAVSASLPERERPTIVDAELDGWLLKPIDFKRLRQLMRGSFDNNARNAEIYRAGQWERGGWLHSFPAAGGSPRRRIPSVRTSPSGVSATLA
ncbi:hypothetical protein JCM3770_005219 [Rhodotorula araucariae]